MYIYITTILLLIPFTTQWAKGGASIMYFITFYMFILSAIVCGHNLLTYLLIYFLTCLLPNLLVSFRPSETATELQQTNRIRIVHLNSM